ncbi:MAG: hypothetical protein AB7V36_11230 [Bacteroidales bacterium]
MQKSSSFTFLYKFIFTPLMIIGFGFGSFMGFFQDNGFGITFAYGMTLTWLWLSFWLVLMSLRLRNIEATRENLVIKSFGKRKTVNYADVEWVSQPAMMNPKVISLKYYDRETEESKQILIMPPTQSQMFSFSLFEEHDLTIFLRENISVAHPSYSKDNEPSRWTPLGLILLSGMPAFLFYFLIIRNIFA